MHSRQRLFRGGDEVLVLVVSAGDLERYEKNERSARVRVIPDRNEKHHDKSDLVELLIELLTIVPVKEGREIDDQQQVAREAKSGRDGK